MTARLSVTYTGLQPDEDVWIFSCCTPSIVGREGPVMSISINPICEVGFRWPRSCERSSVNVDFPTPPFPERTRILWRMVSRREWIAGRDGSGIFGAVEQMLWFGQPAQADILPACSLSGPGQFSTWQWLERDEEKDDGDEEEN